MMVVTAWNIFRLRELLAESERVVEWMDKEEQWIYLLVQNIHHVGLGSPEPATRDSWIPSMDLTRQLN